MPIRNMGTLLENIAVVEALRIIAQNNKTKSPIDFLNSFAMPPFSDWRTHAHDSSFNEDQLKNLASKLRLSEVSSYQGMMWHCLQHPLAQTASQGPNGALLCSILAHHLASPIRLWLNDVPNGHYGNSLPNLEAINTTVQQVLGLPAAPQNPVVVCGQAWPDSLMAPERNNLTETLATWGTNAHARLGFLDPMRYRECNAQDSETDSASHQLWLGLLAKDFPRNVISVHFTGHRNQPDLAREIQRMHQDGVAQGYQRTVLASHGHYFVICNVRHPHGEVEANSLAIHLQQAIRSAWISWSLGIHRRKPPALQTCVL